MNLQLLMVCSDPYFSALFSNYAGESHRGLSVSCFTDEEKGYAHWLANQSTVQVILSNQAFLERCQPGPAVRICLTDMTQGSQDRQEIQYLNVFQQRRDILSDLLSLLSAHIDLHQSRPDHGSVRVISFFSTQGGSGKTSLAYLTALLAAQGKSAAYVSLEPCPCTQQLYSPVQCPLSGEEFLYAVRDRQNPAKFIPTALCHNSSNVYVLPPVHSLQDLLELNVEDWEFMLKGLLQQSGMDYLILDLGSELSPLARMAFTHSDLSVLVYTDSAIGQEKRERLLSDPGLDGFGLPPHCLEVRNRCRQKVTATEALIPFPFSQTMDKGGDLSAVLSGNAEFRNGCAQILQALAGKE